MPFNGIINTSTHPKALWPGVKAWWGRMYAEHTEEWTHLFETDTSHMNFEQDVQITGFGLAPQKSEGANIEYDSELQGAISTYVHIAYALGYIVTKEELDDNLYAKVSKTRSGALAFAFRQTKENVAVNIYNRAFNTSYTYGDGKALCVTDHPLVGGGTTSNRLAVDADLSEASLEDMTIQIMGTTDDRGNLINIQPKSLIIPRQEIYNAARILKSAGQSGTANNDINALKAMNAIPGGAIVNHYLTGAHAWFIRTNVPNGMKHYQRMAISFEQDNDFSSYNARAKSYERYSFGGTDTARAVFGSNGP